MYTGINGWRPAIQPWPNVFPATAADLRAWHKSGQLRAVRTRDAMVGLLAVAPGRIGWIDGDEINEEVIAVEHQGHGYAALAQAAWAAHIARDQRQLLIGTIDRLNTSSRKPPRLPAAAESSMRCSFR